jgi:hypothetical protein
MTQAAVTTLPATRSLQSEPAEVLIKEARGRGRRRMIVAFLAGILVLGSASAAIELSGASRGNTPIGVPTGLSLPRPVTASQLQRLQRSPGYDFASAKVQWEGEWQLDSGALQSAPLLLAMSDLQRGLASGVSKFDGWIAAIHAIGNFERLPLTSVTLSDRRQASDDWALLNRFFGLGAAPRTWYGAPSGPSFRAALAAWARQPTGTSRGVNVTELRVAIGELERSVAASPSLTPLYDPAIADLICLETASRSVIASSTSWKSLAGEEIVFLNSFFFDYGNGLLTPVLAVRPART